jgi:hypothetical protein
LKAEGFGDLVKQRWNSYHCLGTPCFVLAYKLKWLKLDLKCWNKEVFENVKVRKKFFLEKIRSIDLIEKESPLAEEEIVKRALLKVDLEKVPLLLSWTDVACVREMASLCTIFFFIVMWLLLYSVLFSCFGMSWVMPQQVIDLFVCWWSSKRPRSPAV